MRKYLLLGLSGGLVWASAAFGVSRVGGGTCSNGDEGFSYTVPLTFEASAVFSDDSVQFSGGWSVSVSGGVLPEKVNQYLLRNQLPVLASVTDRAQFAQYFLGNHWTQAPSADPCVEVFVYESTTGLSAVAGWGDGKGIMISAPNTAHSRWGMEQVMQSLKLDPGACAWK